MSKPYIIANNGAFLRNPRGGVEDVAAMKAAGMKWLALNIGDYFAWVDWATVIAKAQILGVKVFPWARCRTLTECRGLLTVAGTVGNRGILNIEDEFERSSSGGPAPCPPDEVRKLIDQFPNVVTSFSTGGWLMNAVDYTPIAHRPLLLQVFWEDLKHPPTDMPQLTKDCIVHAKAKGIKYPGVTFQTVRSKPEFYDFWTGKRSWYTGDDIPAGTWSEWA